MPTAAKLVAAIAYGLVAWGASRALVPSFPENADLGYFAHVNVAIGALSGWFVMGQMAGAGYGAAVTSGIRTTGVMVFYALLAHAIWAMLERALDMRYDGIMEALTGVFAQFGKFGLVLLGAPVAVGVVLIGGVAAAWGSEFAARRWH